MRYVLAVLLMLLVPLVAFSQDQTSRVTGTLASATQTIPFTAFKTGGGTISASGTWAGTLRLQCRVGVADPLVTIVLTPVGGGAAVTSFTSNGMWSFFGGYSSCVVNASAWTSGTATISALVTNAKLLPPSTVGGVSSIIAGSGISVDQATGAVTVTNTGSGQTPGDADKSLQFNNAGAFGGIAGSSWDGTTLTLPTPIVLGAVPSPGGTPTIAADVSQSVTGDPGFVAGMAFNSLMTTTASAAGTTIEAYYFDARFHAVHNVQVSLGHDMTNFVTVDPGQTIGQHYSVIHDTSVSGAGTISELNIISAYPPINATQVTLGRWMFIDAPALSNGATLGTWYAIQAADLAGLTVTTAKGFINYANKFVVDAAGAVTAGAWNGTTVGGGFGGTGQTAYTKGDLLVTPGSTTLNKLGVGTDGEVLTADAASTNGVKWAAAGGGGANTALSNLASVAINTALLGVNGSNTAPAYSFTAEAGDGFYRRSSGVLTFVHGTVNHIEFIMNGESSIRLASDGSFYWTAGDATVGPDTTINRAAAGQVKIQDSLQLGSTTLTLTAGALGLPKMTASASAPGASGSKLEVVCGTNSGTAKLVMYAGTSGTAVTVIDNVGAGVTGC